MDDTPDQLREEPEFELVKPPEASVISDDPPRPIGWWIAGVVLVIVAGVAGYYLVSFGPPAAPQQAAAPAAVTPPTEAVPEPPSRLGVETPAIDVPPLDASDALVRTLVKALTANPRVAAWLVTPGLIRNFTVVVANIADGVTPSKHLGTLRPSGPFMVVTRGADMRPDPRSFARYDGLAAAATSVDPVGAARLYTTLKPRIAEAYRDLGQPDTPFDRTLERAIVRLLEVPVLDGTPGLKPHGGTGYAFVDQHLEDLTAAQKQLLRMGPGNVRAIQGALRAIAVALGIPESRLPAPTTIRVR